MTVARPAGNSITTADLANLGAVVNGSAGPAWLNATLNNNRERTDVSPPPPSRVRGVSVQSVDQLFAENIATRRHQSMSKAALRRLAADDWLEIWF